jgi:hypothetical protein
VEIIWKITRVYSPDWSKFVDIEHAVGARHLQRRSAAEKGFSTMTDALRPKSCDYCEREFTEGDEYLSTPSSVVFCYGCVERIFNEQLPTTN